MSRYERAAIAAVALMVVAAAAIFFYAPTDYLQGSVQRIFYLHVSSAIAAYGCFAVVLVGGIFYLRTENMTADRFARAGAVSGVVFTTVTLVMGMLWAKPIWNTFWTWDARLTSTLVLWMIYAGYLLVRRLADPGRQAARLAAVVGIFGFIDVRTNARRCQRRRHIDPLVRRLDGLLAYRRIRRVLAVSAIDRNVDHRRVSFLHGRAVLGEVLRVSGRENRTPWLDVVHVELLGHMRREIFQLHLLIPGNFAGRLSVPALPAHDKFTKGISCHGDPLPGISRKFDRRSGRSCP